VGRPLRPSLHLGQPLPRLLKRRLDLEDPLDGCAGHELDLLRLATFDCRGDVASRSMRQPIDDIGVMVLVELLARPFYV
jgi:hypothetical protein